MRDCTRIAAAYAAMNRRDTDLVTTRVLRATGAVLAFGLALFMADHLLGDLGARVAADVAKGAHQYCGAC